MSTCGRMGSGWKSLKVRSNVMYAESALSAPVPLIGDSLQYSWYTTCNRRYVSDRGTASQTIWGISIPLWYMWLHSTYQRLLVYLTRSPNGQNSCHIVRVGQMRPDVNQQWCFIPPIDAIDKGELDEYQWKNGKWVKGIRVDQSKQPKSQK